MSAKINTYTPFGNGENRDRLIRSLIILLVALSILSGHVAFAATAGSGEDGGYSSYTERYWEAAANRPPAAGAEQYASYTERYWQAAAARAQTAAADTDGYIYYTQRYWQAADARAQIATAGSEAYATYTDRYWQAAAVRNNMAGIATTTN